jgi:CBS domain-containing protein
MNIEFLEIRDYLASLAPFDELEDSLLKLAAENIQITYFSKASPTCKLDYSKPSLYIVRTGAFEIRSKDGELLERIQADSFFGYPSLLTGGNITNHLQVLEDGLVYMLDENSFRQCRQSSRTFDRFFNQAHAKRLGRIVRAKHDSGHLTRKVKDLVRHELVTIDIAASVQQAAQLMRNQRVSSILLIDNEQLLGILTDRDLRNRILAANLPANTPARQVMTPSPVTISEGALLFQAMLCMSEHNIHHLPVTRNGKPVGVVSASDIALNQQLDPVMLINRISRCENREAVKQVSCDIPALLQQLIDAGARADDIGRSLSTVTDVITRQLIKQAEEKLGPAPVAYNWIAFGSQARRDQTGYSDQDNALLLHNDFQAEHHDAYFKTLAEYVCAGLDDCGYRYCNGEIMAQTDRWRQPIAVWQGYFDNWIRQPSPKALMHSSIFFDLRSIAGESSLCSQLQQHILAQSGGNDIFLASMTQNALHHRPPLGLFKQFVLEIDGEQKKTLNLKHRGVVPIIDIVRIYSLAAGLDAVNTQDRLQALANSKLISLQDTRTLSDSLEYIARLRLENQGRQLAAGRRPSNFLNPDNVSGLVRQQLRDAFKLVNTAQDAVHSKFTRGFL